MAATFMISTLLEASDNITFIGDNLGVQPSCDNNKTSNIQHYGGAVLQYKNPSRIISKTIGWIKGQHALLHLKNLKLLIPASHYMTGIVQKCKKCAT